MKFRPLKAAPGAEQLLAPPAPKPASRRRRPGSRGGREAAVAAVGARAAVRAVEAKPAAVGAPEEGGVREHVGERDRIEDRACGGPAGDERRGRVADDQLGEEARVLQERRTLPTKKKSE